MSLKFEFCLQFPRGSTSTELSDFHQSAQSGNQHECKHTLKNMRKQTPRVMTSLLMSSLPISILHWHFWCRYSNISRDIVALLPFPALPPERPEELARRLSERILASYKHILQGKLKGAWPLTIFYTMTPFCFISKYSVIWEEISSNKFSRYPWGYFHKLHPLI